MQREVTVSCDVMVSGVVTVSNKHSPLDLAGRESANFRYCIEAVQRLGHRYGSFVGHGRKPEICLFSVVLNEHWKPVSL